MITGDEAPEEGQALSAGQHRPAHKDWSEHWDQFHIRFTGVGWNQSCWETVFTQQKWANTTSQGLFVFPEERVVKQERPHQTVGSDEARGSLDHLNREKHALNFHLHPRHSHNHRDFWALTTGQILVYGFACINSFYPHKKPLWGRYCRQPILKEMRPRVLSSCIGKVDDGLSVWVGLDSILTGPQTWLNDREASSMVLIPLQPNPPPGKGQTLLYLWDSLAGIRTIQKHPSLLLNTQEDRTSHPPLKSGKAK